MAENQPKPTLLYVCAVIPSISGNGLAMRCGMVLEALAEHYRVTLLATQNWTTPLPEVFRDMCCDSAVIPFNGNPQERMELAAAAFQDRQFDIVHVFRLAAWPFARSYFRQADQRPLIHLDLDDIESKTYRRIASIHRQAGETAEADANEAQAQRSLMLEALTFRVVDRIYVCSEADRMEILDRCRAEVRVLRNAVRVPASTTPMLAGPEFRFLFIGTLGYYPNEDAIRFFCTDVLPLIRARSTNVFHVDVVGVGPRPELLALNDETVHIVGRVPSVEPWYAACHAVIVPLRAGGGTRIKILEAFSYRRAVISTSLGAEGLEAESGLHLIIADTATDLAEACLALMAQRDRAEALAANAESLVKAYYSSDALKANLWSQGETEA